MAAISNKDVVLVVSLVLSLVSLILLFGVTWYFHSSLDLLQKQVEYDREALLKLQEQVNVSLRFVVLLDYSLSALVKSSLQSKENLIEPIYQDSR